MKVEAESVCKIQGGIKAPRSEGLLNTMGWEEKHAQILTMNINSQRLGKHIGARICT